MSNKFLPPEDYERLHKEYLTDPVIKSLNKSIATLYCGSVPDAYFDSEFKIFVEYDGETEYLVKQIKDIIGRYISSKYHHLHANKSRYDKK